MEQGNRYDDPNMQEEPILKEGLRLQFTREHNRAWELKRQGKGIRQSEKPPVTAATDDEYKAECSVLPKAAFRDDLVPDPENINDMLEDTFRPGHTFCLAALPFTDSGFGKDNLEPAAWEKFLKEGNFLKYLNVDPADNLTSGFSDVDGYFFDHLPDRLKADVSRGGCSFKLDYPAEPGNWNNKSWFSLQFAKAYENLKRFLQEPLNGNHPDTLPEKKDLN